MTQLDTIPGVARQTAEVIVSEIGIDMSRFPTADHLAAWAGVAPGNNESAGKRRSGKTRPGNKALRAALNQAAQGAAHTSILVISYHLIQRNEPYRDLGGDYFDKQKPEATAKRLGKRLVQLGFQVSLQSTLPVAV